jgi:hypothetical protein
MLQNQVGEEGTMRIRNIMKGEVLDAELRTDHAASNYG